MLKEQKEKKTTYLTHLSLPFCLGGCRALTAIADQMDIGELLANSSRYQMGVKVWILLVVAIVVVVTEVVIMRIRVFSCKEGRILGIVFRGG